MEETNTLAAESPNTGNRIALNYALYISLISIILGLGLHLAGIDTFNPEMRSLSWAVSLVSYIVILGGIYLGIVKYRDTVKGGTISFGDAFLFGIKIVLIYAVIFAIWTYIFIRFIYGDYMGTMQAMMEEQWAKQGMDDDQIQSTWDMTSKFMTPGMMSLFAIGGNLLMGAILDLIASLVAKKEPAQTPNW